MPIFNHLRIRIIPTLYSTSMYLVKCFVDAWQEINSYVTLTVCEPFKAGDDEFGAKGEYRVMLARIIPSAKTPHLCHFIEVSIKGLEVSYMLVYRLHPILSRIKGIQSCECAAKLRCHDFIHIKQVPAVGVGTGLF